MSNTKSTTHLVKDSQETDFSFSYETHQLPEAVYKRLLDVRNWWSGLYQEEIIGSTDVLNQEFTYSAGRGLHYSRQKLVELVPNKKIVWLVTDSKLSFLADQDEWTGTKIIFEIGQVNDKTRVRFLHQGLTPQIECYQQCSNGWSGYLQRLKLSHTAPTI